MEIVYTFFLLSGLSWRWLVSLDDSILLGEKIKSKLLLIIKLKCPLLKDCALWLAWADVEGRQKVKFFSFR